MTATNQPISASSPVFSIAVTAAASTSVSIPFRASTLRIVNTGANTAYFSVGTGAQTATVPTATSANTCTPVLAGSDVGFTVDSTNPLQISAICAAAQTATLVVQAGDGT